MFAKFKNHERECKNTMAKKSYVAEETNAASRHHFCKTGTSELGVLLNDTASGQVIGILEEDLENGKGTDVSDTDGDVTFLQMAETCDEGALLKSNLSGRGIKLATNATPENQFYAARALEAATGATDIINVVIEKGFKYQ